MICPECDGEMILRNSKYGKFYGCSNWPRCNATHGAHQNSGKPLGIPADKETKAWRIKAHDEFDKLWKVYGYKRTEAYKVLAQIMGLEPKRAHISMFDQEQCQQLIKLLAKK